MKYFCENCHELKEQNFCAACSKQNLGTPKKNDYCFLVEANYMFGEMLKGLLEDENIVFADFPSGSGIRTTFALRQENLKIFVMYEFFDRAKELLYDIYDNIEAHDREELKKNLDRLFILPRNEKNIKKALKLPKDVNLKDYCLDKISNPDRVINKGSVSPNSDFLFVYKESELFIIYTSSYEIMSAKIIPKGYQG